MDSSHGSAIRSRSCPPAESVSGEPLVDIDGCRRAARALVRYLSSSRSPEPRSPPLSGHSRTRGLPLAREKRFKAADGVLQRIRSGAFLPDPRLELRDVRSRGARPVFQGAELPQRDELPWALASIRSVIKITPSPS